MGMRSSHNLRLEDFCAGIWFKPAPLGGLSKATFGKSLKTLAVQFGDGPTLPAGVSVLDEWILPGEGRRCAVRINEWRDADRRLVDVGTSFEVLSLLTLELFGPPCCIGLGRIVELRDPEGRRFIADAEVEVSLDDDSRPFHSLAGVRTRLHFPRLFRHWEGHFDEGAPLSGKAGERTKRWLCFHDFWHDSRAYPGIGHPILAGDEFEILEGDTRIGQGRIVEWVKGPRVCFPKGWRIGSGVEWRSSWS